MKVTMSAEFTDEQFKYFAIHTGWDETKDEDYMTWCKRLCLENMQQFISTPLRNNLLREAEAKVAEAVEVIKTEVKLED
jgi:spore maturation protein CgeB